MSVYDDWAPLAERDPVPGDPNAVGALARQLKATAVTIRSQLERLHSIDSDEFWSGIAAERFKEHQEELHQPLEQQALRHERVGEALLLYAPDLGEAKRQASTARDNAREAQTAMIKAKGGLADMDAQAKKAQADADEWNAAHPDLPPRQPDTWWGPNWHGELDTATGNLEAAKTLLRQACELRDGAASACAKKIGEAVHDGLKNKSGIFHFAGRLAHDFSKLPGVKAVTDAVAIAAAVVGVAAIVFPVLAPLAIGLGAVALVLDSIAAMGGDGSWKTVAMDGIGLVTMGAGRVLAGGARAAATGAKAAEGLKVAQGFRTEAEALEATKGVKGALRGMKVVTGEGKTIYGAAARSAKIKQLEGAADAAEKGIPKLIPRGELWKDALAPKQIGSELWKSSKELVKHPVKELGGSLGELKAEAGFTHGAHEVTGLGRQAFRLRRIEVGVEAGGALPVAHHVGVEVVGHHLDEAAAQHGGTVSPISSGPER